jgi:hypothetical protein
MQAVMKKLLALVLLVVVVFVALNRERIYVRDPLASVTRDAVAEPGVQVFTNYNNDVLLEHDDRPRYLTLLQHGQPVGSPRIVHCIHFVACMTEAPIPPVIIAAPTAHIESMTSKQVAFHDATGREAVVTLY